MSLYSRVAHSTQADPYAAHITLPPAPWESQASSEPEPTIEERIVEHMTHFGGEFLVSTLCREFVETGPKMRDILSAMNRDGLIARVEGSQSKGAMYSANGGE